MLTLFDYLPSQNSWKVRQILKHLAIPYETEIVSIFERRGQDPDYLAINPWGAVPAIRLENGRVLSESNAILAYLGHGSAYRPADPFAEAKVLQWLSFENAYVQPTIALLRFWTLTGKLPTRPETLVAYMRGQADRVLGILDRELSRHPFIAGGSYSIADVSVFAYTHLANDAGLATEHLPAFQAWVERVRGQPGFLAEVHPYSIDPHSSAELP